jgi:hypothetical protein
MALGLAGTVHLVFSIARLVPAQDGAGFRYPCFSRRSFS